VANFSTPWDSLLPGDGAYTDIVAGGNPFYVSAQQGVIYRARRSNNQLLYTLVQPVTPNDESDFLFIAPFQLDPNNPRVMYLAVANGVWRNSNLDAITVVDNQNPVTTNWSALNSSAIANTQVTTLAVSKTPANRLYFGATDYQSSTVLVRVNNAPTNPAGTNITPASVSGGAYPACIGIHPNNADEIIAVFSNYRISSSGIPPMAARAGRISKAISPATKARRFAGLPSFPPKLEKLIFSPLAPAFIRRRL
jgi:hypothetical protein